IVIGWGTQALPRYQYIRGKQLTVMPVALRLQSSQLSNHLFWIFLLGTIPLVKRDRVQ
ncbi:hypothetical protein U1Q18_014712, partial [Sarracenia purpurea var. burkii]